MVTRRRMTTTSSSSCCCNRHPISSFSRLLAILLVVQHTKLGAASASPFRVDNPIGNGLDCADCPSGNGRADEICACQPCIEGQTYSYKGYCYQCHECPPFVIVLSRCNVTSDIQCSWLHCSDGREWDRERLQCVTASPVASTTPSVAVRRSPPVASTSLETRTRRSTTSVAKTSDISRPATSTPVRPSSRWDTPDEGGGSDTSVMLIVAVTTSLFVLLVLTIVGLVKWCKRAPSHLPRPTPDTIKYVCDLPDEIILMVGCELANKNNPAYFQQLLAELGAQREVGMKLEVSFFRHVDDFSRALFYELEKFKPQLTVSDFCDTLKALGAVTLVRDILQWAKELRLTLDEYNNLDEAIEESVNPQMIISQQDPQDDAYSHTGPIPDPDPPMMGNNIRHSSQSTLISVVDDSE